MQCRFLRLAKFEKDWWLSWKIRISFDKQKEKGMKESVEKWEKKEKEKIN